MKVCVVGAGAIGGWTAAWMARAGQEVAPVARGAQPEARRRDGAPIDCLDPQGRMLAALDPRHIVGCVVHGAAEVTAPGTVSHTAGGRFILGEPDGSRSARVLRLAAAMAAAGFDAPVTAEIR